MLETIFTLNDIGDRCAGWRQRNFGATTTPERAALQICEEAGEVARAVGKISDGIRESTRGNLADELGDVVLCCAAMASEQGIDLDEAVIERVKRMEALDFVVDPEHGGEQHEGVLSIEEVEQRLLHGEDTGIEVKPDGTVVQKMLTKLHKTPGASVEQAREDIEDWIRREAEARASAHRA